MATFTSSTGVAKVFVDNNAGTAIDFTDYLPGINLETNLDTPDATVLSDTAKKFVFGLEDGGEITQDVYLDAGGVVWAQLTALFNARNLACTVTAAPLGTGTGKPKISRETGITKLGMPIAVGELVKVPTTFKAWGATTNTVY